MKILILGKNGQVGQELLTQATELDFDVVALSREELDITNFKSVVNQIEKIKPDIVINASAYHVVPDCETYPDKAYLINAIAVKNLADICEKNDITLVHYSTDYVFDGLKGKPYKENDLPNPLQVYGISKLAGEYGVLNYCKKGVIIRACYIYGGKTGSRAKKGNFVLSILNQAKDVSELEVASEMIVSPTFASDLALATLQLIKNKNIYGIYHLPNEGFCSLADFATSIIKYSGLKTKIIPIDRGGKAGNLRRPLFSVLKNTRAKKLKVFLPHWENAIKRYLKTL